MAYVLLLALIALGVPLALSLRDRVDAEVRNQAHSQAEVVAASASTRTTNPPRRGTLDRLARISARTVRGRVIVVNRSGRVIADSAGSGELGADYSSRPEITTALAGHEYQQDRKSSTLGTEILATAVPVSRGGRRIGAVRITQSVAAVTGAVRRAILGLVLLGGVVLLLALIAGALIAQQIARPIHRLDLAARRVAAGELETKAPVEGSAEQRSLALTFNEMTDRIARLLRSQQDFVADASHQLRTPLTGLRLQLEELRAETPAGEPRASRLDAGMVEIDRLSEMVDELLILSRAGEHELPGQRLELGDVADRLAERWRNTAGDAGVELRRSSDGDAGTIWCASADLDRALDALVENAIRYAPAGSEVEVRSAPGRIEVLDRGPGLGPGEEEAVFERFYRGRAGRAGPKGTGLGLPIARELASQWHGAVSLENRPGGGARASVMLPLSAAAATSYGGSR